MQDSRAKISGRKIANSNQREKNMRWSGQTKGGTVVDVVDARHAGASAAVITRALCAGPQGRSRTNLRSEAPLPPVKPGLQRVENLSGGGELGGAGLGNCQRVGDCVARFARPILSCFAAAGDLDGLGGVWEGQASGHRGDLQGAALGMAVAVLTGLVCHRDLSLGQRAGRANQAGRP